MIARVILLSVLVGSVGCGDDHHDHASAGEEACEHLENGPVRSITAGVDAASAPDASEGHSRYDVTLVQIAGQPGGFVKVAIADAGEHILFFDQDVALVVTDAGGAPVVTTRTVGDADCDRVAVAFTMDLAVGTHTLALTPTSATTTSVSLVLERAVEEHSH